MSQYLAIAFAAAGALVILLGLFMLDPVAALVIIAGLVLLALGLFAVEVPAT